jgi:Leucine-rich repeat (LRR) protein
VGELGNSFLGEMTNLQYLYLGQTFFEHYGVPPELSTLSNLVELDISFTSWFGPLNSNPWSGLVNLEYLAMNGNVFKTTLPEELIQLPKLEYLYVVDSFLQGDLEWVSRMPVIRELWVDNNPLSTQIPESLSRASTLASFSAGNCGLTGAIPGSVGNLAESLTHLWLNNNALTSFIPGDLSKLSNLQTLILTGNEFNSAVPSEICFDLGRLQRMEVDSSAHCECCTCCGHDSFSVQRVGTRIWKHRNE